MTTGTKAVLPLPSVSPIGMVQPFCQGPRLKHFVTGGFSSLPSPAVSRATTPSFVSGGSPQSSLTVSFMGAKASRVSLPPAPPNPSKFFIPKGDAHAARGIFQDSGSVCARALITPQFPPATSPQPVQVATIAASLLRVHPPPHPTSAHPPRAATKVTSQSLF